MYATKVTTKALQAAKRTEQSVAPVNEGEGEAIIIARLDNTILVPSVDALNRWFLPSCSSKAELRYELRVEHACGTKVLWCAASHAAAAINVGAL